jgi:hypothetical protein
MAMSVTTVLRSSADRDRGNARSEDAMRHARSSWDSGAQLQRPVCVWAVGRPGHENARRRRHPQGGFPCQSSV